MRVTEIACHITRSIPGEYGNVRFQAGAQLAEGEDPQEAGRRLTRLVAQQADAALDVCAGTRDWLDEDEPAGAAALTPAPAAEEQP